MTCFSFSTPLLLGSASVPPWGGLPPTGRFRSLPPPLILSCRYLKWIMSLTVSAPSRPFFPAQSESPSQHFPHAGDSLSYFNSTFLRRKKKKAVMQDGARGDEGAGPSGRVRPEWIREGTRVRFNLLQTCRNSSNSIRLQVCQPQMLINVASLSPNRWTGGVPVSPVPLLGKCEATSAHANS